MDLLLSVEKEEVGTKYRVTIFSMATSIKATLAMTFLFSTRIKMAWMTVQENP